MAATYDEAGNYVYPDGFDPATGEWLPGHEAAQAEWERQYAEAHARWEAHKKQVEEQRKADAEAGAAAGEGDAPQSYTSSAPEATGTLATDEALQALRDKLTGA
jgi:small subunit ribosomal protein S1